MKEIYMYRNYFMFDTLNQKPVQNKILKNKIK